MESRREYILEVFADQAYVKDIVKGEHLSPSIQLGDHDMHPRPDQPDKLIRQ